MFMGCKHLTQFSHHFFKIQRKQHGGQESAKRLQFGHGSCHFFEILSLEHTHSGSGEKKSRHGLQQSATSGLNCV